MKPGFTLSNSARTISSHTATVIVLLSVATLAIAYDGTNAVPPKHTMTYQERVAAETPGWLEAYFGFNHITPIPNLRVGMKLEEFIKVLGEPTRKYQRPKGRMVNGKPEEGYEDWVEWYHNPGNRHVAPIIRVRVENGIVTRLEANRA